MWRNSLLKTTTKSLVILLLISVSFLGFAIVEEETDVGVSFMPATEDVFLDSGLVGLHVAHRFAHVLYASWDALISPPKMVQSWTTSEKTDHHGTKLIIPGVYRPGFLNLFDFGLGLPIGPVFISAQAGINYLYILEQFRLAEVNQGGALGANVRVGAGIRFDSSLSFNHEWAIVANGTVVFPSIQSALQTLSDLGTTGARGDAARNAFSDYMLYSAGFLIYL